MSAFEDDYREEFRLALARYGDGDQPITVRLLEDPTQVSLRTRRTTGPAQASG